MEKELKIQLKVFDRLWVEYEEKYISELIVIEESARLPVTRAIKYITELTIEEQKEIAKGKVITGVQSEQAKYSRRKLVDMFREMNSVANIEGKGRDDLGVEVLEEAEKVLSQVSAAESVTLRKLAENIKLVYEELKELMLSYGSNIEVVDPQLKNNQVNIIRNSFDCSKDMRCFGKRVKTFCRII